MNKNDRERFNTYLERNIRSLTFEELADYANLLKIHNTEVKKIIQKETKCQS